MASNSGYENVAMADSHRPVGRYRQNIVADTTQLVHNINGKRPEYAQGYRKADVYEQYARPKSRRSPVPVSEMEITERPRTSRGRRSHYHCKQDTAAVELERPMSRRGYNSSVEGIERPMTRHGRKSISESMPERPVTRHGRHSQQDFIERPSTRHGRTQSESYSPSQDHREGSTSPVDILSLDAGLGPTPTPPPKPNIRARPKSAKGRVRPKPVPRPSIDRDETPTPALIMSPTPGNVTSPTPQPQVITPMPQTADSRPSSSLNRFNPLPSIGRKPSVDANISEIDYYPRPTPRNTTRTVVPKNVTQTQQDKQIYHTHGEEENSNQPDSFNNLRSQLQRLKTQENLLMKEETDKKPMPKPRAKHHAKAVKSNVENLQRMQNEPVIVSVEPEPEFQTLARRVVLPAEPNQSEEHFVLAVKLPSGQRPQRRFRPSDTLETVINFAELSSQLDFDGCELVCDVPSHLVFRDLKVSIKDSGLKNRTVLHVQVPDEEE